MGNNKIKLSLSTVLLIIAAIAIVIMAFIIFSLTKNKAKTDNEIQQLKNENQSMQNKLDSIQNILNSVTTNTSNTTNTNNEVQLANEAIGKALKNKSWLIENIVSDFDKKQSNEFIDMALNSICFAKLKNDKPTYILERSSNEGQGKALIVVEYENGNVVATELLGAEYSSFEIDFDKNVICISHDVVAELKYYEIKGKNTVLLATGDEDTGTYKINGQTVSIDEFKELKNNYNCEELQTKLTNENIDKYVK